MFIICIFSFFVYFLLLNSTQHIEDKDVVLPPPIPLDDEKEDAVL